MANTTLLNDAFIIIEKLRNYCLLFYVYVQVRDIVCDMMALITLDNSKSSKSSGDVSFSCVCLVLTVNFVITLSK